MKVPAPRPRGPTRARFFLPGKQPEEVMEAAERFAKRRRMDARRTGAASVELAGRPSKRDGNQRVQVAVESAPEGAWVNVEATTDVEGVGRLNADSSVPGTGKAPARLLRRLEELATSLGALEPRGHWRHQ